MPSIDDFLNHKTSDRGAYLNKWKEDGKVNTWMHTECLPIAVWRHGGIPRVVVQEDKDTGEQVTRVWIGKAICHETEDVLKKQFKFTQQGAREIPPEYCPICCLVDYVRRLVNAGRIDRWAPVFKFEGDDEKETVTLHAGPMFMTRKMYEDLDDDEKKAAKKAGVFVKDAWKEVCHAGMNYLFRVVDDSHPESGVQIAFEPQSLGESVKLVISDRRQSKGVEEGNPLLNPYCIQWQYRENEPDFKKKYHALAIEKQQLSPAIEALIYGPAPDISRDIKPFNIQEMRAFLEEHALIKLPWNDIFKVKTRAPKEEARADQESDPEETKPVLRQRPKPAVKAAPKRAPFPEDDDEHAVGCEKCEKAMWDDDVVCPHCDARYTADGKLLPDEPEPPKKPPMRKRGQKVEESDAAEPPIDTKSSGEDEDDLPF